MIGEKENKIKRKERLTVSDGIKHNHGNEYHLIREQDFYPPLDNRYWKSNVGDIDGGDNFADFCKCFFKLLDEEGYFEK